jgi:hypothetical protein
MVKFDVGKAISDADRSFTQLKVDCNVFVIPFARKFKM